MTLRKRHRDPTIAPAGNTTPDFNHGPQLARAGTVSFAPAQCEKARVLASVTTIMKRREYEDLERVHPRYDETLALPLLDKDGDPA